MQRLIDANTASVYTYFSNYYVAQQLKGVPTVLEIPDNPTNGDMIQAMFPNWKIIEHELAFRIYPYGNDSAYFFFDKKWWFAPYKRAEHESNND